MFPLAGSVSVAEAVAVALITVPESAVSVMVITSLLPTPRGDPSVNVSIPPDGVTDGTDETNVVFAGMGKTAVPPVAGSGPKLVTVSVNVTFAPIVTCGTRQCRGDVSPGWKGTWRSWRS